MPNHEASSRIAAALISAAAMLLVALIGYFGIKFQMELPLRATLHDAA